MMVPVHSSAAEYMQSHRDNLFDRWTILPLAGVAVFMVWAASHYTVFDDEAFSCRRYAMPLGEMIAALHNGVEPDPPLYYIAQNVWVHLFGVAPLALRGLSIILFLAGLLVVRVAARAWFDDRTSRWAMLICAVHPAHLFFGFAARWYSLMFLLVAALLWSTARASQDARPPWRRIVAWSIIAAAVCYTNYFGIVIVGLCWLVAINRGRGTHLVVQRWVCAGLIAMALYAVWLPAFWRTATTFGGDHSFMSYVGSASRTTMALLSGNLASIGVLWCWLPLAVLGLCVIVLLVRLRRAVWHVGLVGVGCFVAGVLSRTMIDKYVMTFSGVLCVLLAALLVFDRGAVPLGVRRWRRVAAVCLVIGWLGCGVNLVSGRYWSSLRWHDPFERAIANLRAMEGAPPPRCWVMTHPSARYYYGLDYARRAAREDSHGNAPSATDARPGAATTERVPAAVWRRAAEWPDRALDNFDVACGTPASVLELMTDRPVPSLVTLETSGFAEAADDWGELHAVLERAFVETDRREYLEDPDAALKDRIDPNVHHPRWRITVRTWQKK